MRDFASAPQWRLSLLRVELLDPVDGRVRFREVSKDGSVTYELKEDVPGQKLVTRIVDRDLGYSGSWTYEFSKAQFGTQLRITEDGEVSNILFRSFARFVSVTPAQWKNTSHISPQSSLQPTLATRRINAVYFLSSSSFAFTAPSISS